MNETSHVPAVRVDLDGKGGVDDVAIKDVTMFRLERMDHGSFWLCAYTAEGRHIFWLRGRKLEVSSYNFERDCAHG